MKLCQFWTPKEGKRVGVVEADAIIDITSRTARIGSVLDLIVQGRTAAGIERLARRLARGKRPRFSFADLDVTPSPRRPHLLAPLDAPEIWGAGITYRRSADYYTAHETGSSQDPHRGRTKGIYDDVYESARPELFFKATMSRAVGPNGRIAVRRDSQLTAVEPELALVVGAGGVIVAYTAGNDLSAWDIERANPLFLPQSKMFSGCFAFGPVLVTAGEIGDPHTLDLSCSIHRNGRVLWRGSVNTGEMRRRCPELVEWLGRDNPIPTGTVLSTGTGILVPDEHALRDVDLVEIELARVGVLRNRVTQHR
jgi:2-dehydro-3-deoxy-D-arabinonate dehydratase